MGRISQTVCPQYLVDEPHATEYTSLARAVAKIRAQDKRALSFINLDGSNVSGVGAYNQTGWAREWSGRIDASASDLAGYTYQTYVQEFVDVVRPDVICYDHCKIVILSRFVALFVSLNPKASLFQTRRLAG